MRIEHKYRSSTICGQFFRPTMQWWSICSLCSMWWNISTENTTGKWKIEYFKSQIHSCVAIIWEAFSLKVRANRISVIAEYLYMIVISKVKASTGYQSKQFSDDSSRTLIATWIILRQNKNNNDVAKFPLPRFFALPFTSLLFFRCLEHDVWHQLLWRWVIKCK